LRRRTTMSSKGASTTDDALGAPITVKPRSVVVSGTPIGVDAGLHHPLALDPADTNADLNETRAFAAPELQPAYEQLQAQHDARDAVATDNRMEQLRECVDGLARGALDYVRSFDLPVLVVEDLSYHDRELGECVVEGAYLECWLYPTLLGELTERATAAGITVVQTDADYSTQQCHACADLAVVEDETIRCTTPECPVGEVCRDRSAAVTLARRVR
jgi:putative transposase